MQLKTLTLALIAALPAGSSAVQAQTQQQTPPRPQLVPLLIESSAFADGGIIPTRYTSRGENIQPPFTISNAPANVVSFAIIFHDVDVALSNGTEDVLHWLAWNIPGKTTRIAEGKLPEGSVSGRNVRGTSGYLGPGAPAGPRYHHYLFEFYALSSELDLAETATRAQLLEAMKGKVVAKAGYLGRFRADPK